MSKILIPLLAFILSIAFPPLLLVSVPVGIAYFVHLRQRATYLRTNHAHWEYERRRAEILKDFR